jgi:hypothetical protein
MMTANPKLFAANPRIACRQCPVGTIAQGLMCTVSTSTGPVPMSTDRKGRLDDACLGGWE